MPRKFIEKICPHCNNFFYPLITNIKRGYGKYCSISCSLYKNWKIRKDSRKTVEEEFLCFLKSLIDTKEKDCWLWTKSIDKKGYAILYHSKSIKLHRYSYEYFRGKIINNLYVCHTCDVRNCVNPFHLFLGTHQDNMKDMIIKGRNNTSKGQSVYCAKLKNNDIERIRKLILSGDKIVSIAKRYNVSPSAISKIKYNRSWKDF